MRVHVTSLIERVADTVRQRFLRVATALVLSLAVAACGSAPAAPTPVADSVSSITDMTPAPGTTLRRGQTVTFTGTAGYSLATANAGAVILVIQDQSNQVLQPPGPQPSATVVKGSGQVTLSQSITLPDTGITGVRLFFMLAPAGATSTRATVSVTYPVQ